MRRSRRSRPAAAAWLGNGAFAAAERGLVPDAFVRLGIRHLVRSRLEKERRRAGSAEGRCALRAELDASPIAVSTRQANEQHYELPPELFRLVLGPRLKYSSAWWPGGVNDLAAAEEAMLELTARRAGLEDGQEILELGFGWGSLTLWMAERFPDSRILAVSNSSSQRRFVASECTRRRLENVEVLTADANGFRPPRTFDRVVSVEMFEHVRNHAALLRRVSAWLRPEGRLFVHVFCHRRYTYPFRVSGPGDWMGRHFFTGGTMPSHDLIPERARDAGLESEDHWWLDGTHYARTAEAWLDNLDARRAEVLPVLRGAYGVARAERWLRRWRFFFMAVAEMFGHASGGEWGVGHYLLARGEDARLEKRSA